MAASAPPTIPCDGRSATAAGRSAADYGPLSCGGGRTRFELIDRRRAHDVGGRCSDRRNRRERVETAFGLEHLGQDRALILGHAVECTACDFLCFCVGTG